MKHDLPPPFRGVLVTKVPMHCYGEVQSSRLGHLLVHSTGVAVSRVGSHQHRITMAGG
jgi:hypothetical protein